MTEILFNEERNKRAVSNFGNPYRFLKLAQKAERGEEITFVTIGGSITTSCNASCFENHYGCLVENWLKENFPNAKIKFISAGIGATGSLVGVHRLDRDVLCHNPDFVLVEFSVNDGLNGFAAEEYYDNLIYKILNFKTSPAVLCVGMVDENGGSAQESHLKVAKHYDIPYLSYKDAVWQDLENGTLKWSTLSNDGVHPIDAGHKLIADLVNDCLKKSLKMNIADFNDIKCDKPFTNLKYQNAKIYHAGQLEPSDFGCFVIEDILVNEVKGVWVANTGGEPLKFELENVSNIFLSFERTNKGNGGKAVAEVGGVKTEMDSDFTGGWGVYYNSTKVYESETPGDVTLTITPDLEEGKRFALVGILVS